MVMIVTMVVLMKLKAMVREGRDSAYNNEDEVMIMMPFMVVMIVT